MLIIVCKVSHPLPLQDIWHHQAQANIGSASGHTKQAQEFLSLKKYTYCFKFMGFFFSCLYDFSLLAKLKWERYESFSLFLFPFCLKILHTGDIDSHDLCGQQHQYYEIPLCYMLHVKSLKSHITYNMSYVTCHMSLMPIETATSIATATALPLLTHPINYNRLV